VFHSYDGKLLLAMPGMGDPRFSKSAIYMCSHNEEGAMGISVNQRVDGLTFAQLLSQLNIGTSPRKEIPIHSGGPVETGRGFVLHTSDYFQSSTLKITDDISLSATVDILTLLARGEGPHKALLALGYAGWGEGQLEEEINRNSWLTVDATEDLLFNTPLEEKWTRAMALAGIDSVKLSAEAGHA
jgi:putative transcriptional regulator